MLIIEAMKNILLLLAASALFIAGCCSLPGGPDAVALVPYDAKVVAILKPDAILLDSDFSQFYAEANNGKDLTNELSGVLEGTEIDPRTVSKMVFFSIEDGNISSAYMFQDPPGIGSAESALRSNSAWTSLEYNGYPIYQSGERSIAFVGGNVVAGGLPALKAVIDVKNGMKLDLAQNQKMMGMLNALDQGAPVIIASELTPAVRAQIASSQGPLNSAAASMVDSASLQVKKGGTGISLKIALSAGNPADAFALKGAIYGASTLLTSMAEDGGALKGFLNMMSVGESGSTITISVETTADELRSVKAEMDRAGA